MEKSFPVYMALLLGVAMLPVQAYAQSAAAGRSDPEFDKILEMDIADLTVTSVAKRDQKLTDTPAAVYVVTQEEIRRAGVNSIVEALRLVPGVQVARVMGNRWAVSARGFNGALSNKILVQIDGRSIYTPVFSGTYWEDQSTLIQDIDRIEVVRGPGASLYGANAVNGVINIITKPASETQGNLVSALGTTTGGLVEARHGGKLGDNSFYRVYGQYTETGSSKRPNGGSNHDDRTRQRTGFRWDKKDGSSNSYTLQGDMYNGNQGAISTFATLTAPYSQTFITDNESFGGNVLGRWIHKLSDDSQLNLQAYVDHYTRKEMNSEQRVTTLDFQAQHSVRVDERNHFIWGGGVRSYLEDLQGAYPISVSEEYGQHELINLFAQNEYAVIPDVLYWTLGSKFEYNDFTGFEVQPSTRLSWHPTQNQTVWGAISRAVRMPSTIEDDISLLSAVAPTTPVTEFRVVGNKGQKAEELLAYEIGHRIQPERNLSFDTALFYNDFDNLQTIGTASPGYLSPSGSFVIPYQINNLGEGQVYGAEFSANWNVTADWRLVGTYTSLKMDLDVAPGAVGNLNAAEDSSPRNQFSLRSYYNVSDWLHWDNMFYYVDDLGPTVPDYLRFDTRVAFLVTSGLEVSLIGRNLLKEKHTEFPNNPQSVVARTYMGQVIWKF